MHTVVYNCPCCGAPLNYSGDNGKVECEACGNAFDGESLEALQSDETSDLRFTMPQADTAVEGVQAYLCKNCGAELMTEDTTTAMECPYCGSPTVLPSEMEKGVRPEYVVPFTVSKEQATEAFQNYFKGKKLMPNIFLNTKNRIAEMRKLYAPYWLFNCGAKANMTFDARKVRTERKGDWEIKTTEHYLVRRMGSLDFESIPVDGSEKLDDRISESLEPYDLNKAVPFQPAVLAGAMADRADVDAEACQARAVKRVESSTESAIRKTVSGYDSVSVRNSSIRTVDGRVTPVLLPIWLITTEKEEKEGKKTYTFAINGQTGKLTTDVKPDKMKSLIWGAGVFAAVMAIALIALYFMNNLASGTALLAALAALLAALITVGSLRGQLKTASLQAGAGNYVKEGTFDLLLKRDYFLYKNVERRKIEKKD